MHRVLERACHDIEISEHDLFDMEEARLIAELAADQRRSHFADLKAVKSLGEWTRLRTWVIGRAQVLRAKANAGVRPAGKERPARTTGAEVPLESCAMRLRGKADRIRRHGIKAFEVRDFKSGATLDENGMVKADIALQLQAYGLILLEKHRDAEIRLVVDDGVEREVAFDAEARHSARESIARVTNAMPPVGEAMADTLMRPGNGCWGCAVRHVCPGYRQIAPTWWKEYPRELDRASNDVWGTVIEVHGCGRVDVVLRDDAGRRVRVDGVDEKHGITPAMVGMRLWFFGLEATGASRGFDGVRFHPRTFHELPRDRMERRAWALHVFAGGDGKHGEPTLAGG